MFAKGRVTHAISDAIIAAIIAFFCSKKLHAIVACNFYRRENAIIAAIIALEIARVTWPLRVAFSLELYLGFDINAESET